MDMSFSSTGKSRKWPSTIPSHGLWISSPCHRRRSAATCTSSSTCSPLNATGSSALSLSLMKGGGRKLPCSHLSSDTREWQVFPFSEDASPPDDGLGGTMVNGSVYWTFASGSNIRVLNAATLRFSEINPPLHMEGQGEFKPGETKDGKLCLVCAVKLTLVVWIWRPDDDGVDRWILDKTISLQDGLGGDVALNIVAIISGFVYFSTFSEMNQDSCLFMSYCLETEKLNKLCPVTHSYHSYPYIMGFPPSLVCNKVNPQSEEA
uniref:F-box protein AT5G49610-like beta-propeller domain-containing protein n=1 Tax=Aegilops tauschii subsp. strangulata TaxID=200361 RepID=A0A452YSM8_AEGTS